MSDDRGNPYDALGAADDDGGRWAFGTGFGDQAGAGDLADGLDAAVPPGVNPVELARCCLALGDDALVYSHRLQQWLTRLPELEEETAVANIALDLLGQARLLLGRAGFVLGRTEDDLAFFRGPAEFRNVCFAEPADRDFAELTGRLLIFSAWRLALLRELSRSRGSGAPDPVLAAIAAKGVVELAYHRDYAARWVVRLGDGTPESRGRMRAALAALWPRTAELFQPDPALPAVPPAAVNAVLDTVLAAAGLARPAPHAPVSHPPDPAGQGHHPFVPSPWSPAPSGRAGQHTPALTEVLTELQSVARAHPGATW
jgi:ring-1,2-phenylacetyl-CoA epoxidase subunit PaaC